MIKTKKLKRGFIPLTIILMLFTSILLVTPVTGATALITIEDWETYNFGVKSGSNEYISWECLATEIGIAAGGLDSKRLQLGTASPAQTVNTWINLTSDYFYIHQISMYLYLTNDELDSIAFYNDTAKVLEMRWKLIAGTAWIQYNDIILGWTNIVYATGPTEGWLNITHVSGNTINYSWNENFLEGASLNIGDWTNITRIHFVSDSVEPLMAYIDDIVLDVEEERYGDVSGYKYIGDIDYYNPLFLYDSHKYFEEKRFVRMSCDVKAVDLLVSSELHTQNPDLTKYHLKINNEYVGIPSYWVPYKDSYLLRWIDFTVSLDNENPVLEFGHYEYAYADKYWYGIGITPLGVDIDKDSESTLRYHNLGIFFNGGYDGTLYGADLIYRMYYTSEIFKPPQTYIDVIDTDKNSYEQYETVTITGSVSTLLYLNRLIVNKSGVEYVNKTIQGYTFSEFFTPTLDGIYNASIYRADSGIIKTCSFTVTVTSLEHYIYTVNNPVRPIESFTVYFKYNYTVVPCAIVLYNNNDLLKPLKIWKYDTVPVEDSFSYIINAEGIYYFDLCSYYFDNITDTYIYTTIKRHRHICKNEYPNQLSIVLDVVDLGQQQLIYGSHNFLGSNVVIKMNDEVAFNVNDASEFYLRYTPQYSGEYNASLVLVLSDTNLILDYALFSVSGEQPPIPPDVPDVFGLPGAYMYAMFGAFITLGFLIIPFALSMKHKGDTSSVIYAIFGGIGLGVSTLAGLFPLWLPLMVTVIVVTILVIEYKKG